MRVNALYFRLLGLLVALHPSPDIRAEEPETAPYLWEEATRVAEDWRYSSWYGYFSDTAFPWIWHHEHGWQWCMGQSESSVYLWDWMLDAWIWTSQSVYPWLYKTGVNEGWIQFAQTDPSGSRSFFHSTLFDYYSEAELRTELGDPSDSPLPSPLFSVPGGTFIGSQTVALESVHTGASIRYTLDGSIPTGASPLYREPLEFDRITQVRARLFLEGFHPGPVASETYLAIDPALKAFTSSLPIAVIDTNGHNIDTEVYPRGSENPWPLRPVSAVFFDLEAGTDRAGMTLNPQFAGRAGMRLRGNSSQNNFPKKSYKLEIWNEKNEDANGALLGLPEESDWILYAPYSDKTLMRNYLTYSWSRKMGNYVTRTRYLEVFANMDEDGIISLDDYLGVYVLMEKYKRDKDRIDIARLRTSDLSEPGISGGYILKADWREDFQLNRTHLNLEYVDPESDELLPEQKSWIEACFNDVEAAIYDETFHHPLTGEHYTELLDPYSAIDRQIIQELTKNMDGRSVFLQKDRNLPLAFGPVWDYNYSLGNTDASWFWCRDCFGDCSCYSPEGWATFYYDPVNIGTMRWWARFREDPDYWQYWIDRWVALRRSVLSTESILSELETLYALLEAPADRNFERWPILDLHIRGNSYWGTSENPHRYADEVAWLTDWLMVRLAWLDSQFQKSPDFNQSGGLINEGFLLRMTNPNTSGTIFYTLDGSDPRVPFQWPARDSGESAIPGAPSAQAREYTTPVALEGTTVVHSRVLSGDQWGPLRREIFTTSAAIESLRITEIQYHPVIGEAEFIELKNMGPEALELNQIRFTKGIEFTFPEFTLSPGEVILVVANSMLFESEYGNGLPVIGAYSGRLSNGGEPIQLVDAIGQVILEFSYSDNWIPKTDGVGYSLVFIDPKNSDTRSWSLGSNWRASESIGGTPGIID